MQQMPSFLRVVSLLFSLLLVSEAALCKLPPGPAGASTTPPIIVIGFVGGFVRHDDRVHTEVQLADRLREEYSSGISIQTFENHRGKEAHKAVLRLLDANGDSTLSLEEKQNARVIIFGHSWGASETIELARQLEKDGIPVLLTIQVDSVHKLGENDVLIPANVSQAVNFYQLDGMLHGQPSIRAADPAHTRILGNFRSDYKAQPMTCGQYPWYDRLFMKPHIQIECDPAVWNQVESLIRSNLSLEARAPSGNESNSPGAPLRKDF
jgi:pimeloyl-ACP methyl ester carboxylesterase